MKQQMADRFQQQIDRLIQKKIWWLDNPACVGPGGEPEDNLHGREPEVLPGIAKEPEIGHENV